MGSCPYELCPLPQNYQNRDLTTPRASVSLRFGASLIKNSLGIKQIYFLCGLAAFRKGERKTTSLLLASRNIYLGTQPNLTFKQTDQYLLFTMWKLAVSIPGTEMNKY